jgi:hypothetical protein
MNRAIVVTEVDLWPVYTTRANWRRILGIHEETIAKASRMGWLEGDRIGNRHHHTKKQILRWYAPSLYVEIYGEDLTRVK